MRTLVLVSLYLESFIARFSLLFLLEFVSRCQLFVRENNNIC